MSMDCCHHFLLDQSLGNSPPTAQRILFADTECLGVVEWFLYWVRKHGFTMFAIYRIILGAALLLWGAKYIGG